MSFGNLFKNLINKTIPLIFANLQFIAFIFLIFLIIYKNMSVNKHVLYTDNGKRVHLLIDSTDYEDILKQDQIDCNLDSENLVECDFNGSPFGCFNCKNIYSRCVNFERDEILHDEFGTKLDTIPRNEPGKGYCVKINNPEISCSAKNGGKMILVKDDSGGYSYICYCTTPGLFDSLTKYSDCSIFKGCENGNIVEGWDSMENITCSCNEGYIFQKNGIFPTCKLTKNSLLEFEYLAQDRYLLENYRGLNLPNPCLFDAYTGEHIPTHLVELTMTNGIAHCRIIVESSYALVTFNDDYLVGNGGKYANGVVEYMILSSGEEQTIYEYIDKDNYLTGKLIREGNFRFRDKFPYLDHTSGNYGGVGRFYDYIPKFKFNVNMLVYHSEIPILPPLNIFNTISFIPTFVSNFDASHKYFSGNIPYIENSFVECGTMKLIFISKTLLGKFPEFSSNGIEDVGRITNLDILKSEPFNSRYIANLLCHNSTTNDIKMNQDSLIFTGIIANGKNFSSPLVTSKQLVEKFRSSLKDWKSLNIKKYISITDRHPEIAVGAFGASSTVHGTYDDDGVGNPPKDYTKYTIDRGIFKWSETH